MNITCCVQASSELASGSVLLALSTVFQQKGLPGQVHTIVLVKC